MKTDIKEDLSEIEIDKGIMQIQPVSSQIIGDRQQNLNGYIFKVSSLYSSISVQLPSFFL